MLRKFFSRKLAVIALALFLGLIGGVNSASAHAPRYVFYFIGDGMGAAQRQAAEYYLSYGKQKQQESHELFALLLQDLFPSPSLPLPPPNFLHSCHLEAEQ
jgi:hypothetical protein